MTDRLVLGVVIGTLNVIEVDLKIRIRIRLRFDTDSSLGQQLGAADLGCPLVESPQRLLASLRGQRDVEAVCEVG
jgi:hypothetical protein